MNIKLNNLTKPASLLALLFLTIYSCKKTNYSANVITSDIDNFWTMYDSIINVKDSIAQLKTLSDLYLSKASPGLDAIIENKRYTPQDYLHMINSYPKFLNSIRENTYKSKELTVELSKGINNLKSIYTDLKPANIYFTIGAMRSGGSAKDSMVLIGSEFAMMDNTTNISEFKDGLDSWAVNYLKSEPLKNLVLLNVHEYVHTQQNPISDQLLYQCLYEGVAEFISVLAMKTQSNSEAVSFGKANLKVKEAFEKEMFWNRTPLWLWSNMKNQFDVRDLGYHIGYEMSEIYYNKTKNKDAAVSRLINLDYSKTEEIDSFIDSLNYFSKPISELKDEDHKRRPFVKGIKEFENGSKNVQSGIQNLTIEFSEPLNGYNTGVDYSDMGTDAFPKVIDRQWSKDASSWIMKAELESKKTYSFIITQNFRKENGVPLMPYIIEFTTQ